MDGNNDVGLSDARVYEVEHPTFTRDLGGDIVRLCDGRLLYAFPPLPGGPGGILCCDSADEGAVWSEPRVLIPAPEQRYSHPSGEGIGGPAFFVDRMASLYFHILGLLATRTPGVTPISVFLVTRAKRGAIRRCSQEAGNTPITFSTTSWCA